MEPLFKVCTLLLFAPLGASSFDLECQNGCSGHGICETNANLGNVSFCVCDEGYTNVDVVARHNDCFDRAVFTAFHILVIVPGVLNGLQSLYYCISMVTRGRMKRRVHRTMLLMYFHIFFYACILLFLYLSQLIGENAPFPYSEQQQPYLFLNELKSMFIMCGTTVACSLWFTLIPSQFSKQSKFVSRLKSVWTKNIFLIDAAFCFPWLVLAFLSLGTLSPDTVFTLDLVLVAMYCLPPLLIVHKCSFALWYIIKPANSPGKLTSLYGKKHFGDASEVVQNLMKKLRVSIALIHFCAWGAIALSVVMLPDGRFFRRRSHIWMSSMFTVGFIWHLGTFLFLLYIATHFSIFF